MKIAQLQLADRSLYAFEYAGSWYELSVLVADPAAYMQNWEQCVAALQQFNADAHEALDVSNAQYLLPCRVSSFRDFYAFEAHVKTCRTKRDLDMNPDWYKIPVFYFSNHQAMIADGAFVAAPYGCAELDFELELGLVIGKAGKNITRAAAWQHVAGFCILNDFSARDLQRKEMSLQLGPAKGKDFATAMGPYIVPLAACLDRIDGEQVDFPMRAYINDELVAEGNANSLYHTWPAIIEHASRDVCLFPGDVLGSGTVGTGCLLETAAHDYLLPGDEIRLEIDGLGALTNTITERA